MQRLVLTTSMKISGEHRDHYLQTDIYFPTEFHRTSVS